MKKNGIELVRADPASLQELQTVRDTTVTRLMGTAFSKEIYDAALRFRAEVRASRKVDMAVKQ